MFDLSEKTALVTGASGGIGGAIATALHAQGASVVLSGTREEALNALKEQLAGKVFDELLKKAEAAAGASIDVLVNNAGITRDNLFARMKNEEWDQVISVNLSAAFRLSRSALRNMMRGRWGRIINITSVVGVTGNPGQANYAAAKAGLIGMSKSLAYEVATRGITVNCIAPGFIKSAMTDALNETQREAVMARIPSGRLGQGNDIGAACVYLASDEASYVTGQTLHVNGGMAMV
jgi:3-oxoacyl-[acyl-carrier protein] reductase